MNIPEFTLLYALHLVENDVFRSFISEIIYTMVSKIYVSSTTFSANHFHLSKYTSIVDIFVAKHTLG